MLVFELSNPDQILPLVIVVFLFSRGEHILLFLAKTVARQGTEQGQYNANKSSDTKSRTSNVRSIGTPALPAHDLEQPKFAKLALEQTLKDWKALRSMLMSGCNLEESNARFYNLLEFYTYFFLIDPRLFKILVTSAVKPLWQLEHLAILCQTFEAKDGKRDGRFYEELEAQTIQFI